MPTQYQSFDLRQVSLTNSLFKERFELNRAYVMSLTNDNLLQNYYLEAGIRKDNFDGAFRVTMYGHEDDGHDRHWGWESPTSEVRGHFLGHWLSAAARIYQATGDVEVKRKADVIVSELKRCQIKNGNGWAASIPEKYFRLLAEGKATWAPQYVSHKTMMGLCDMYVFAGNTEAMEIIEAFSDWFLHWSEPFTRTQMDDMLDNETGAMLELWANLYGITGKPKYLTLMERYTRSRLFDPLLDGKDILTNRHANTTIPEVHGAARAYEVTGDERWRQIVEAYWNSAVTQRGTFCTGGQTSGEVWTPPFEFSARLGNRTQEHCTVYNMIRLADYLFRWTGEAAYADYIERNLYNGILAQQNAKTGMVSYYLPLEAGAKKVWGSPTYDFWCCHGTLVQAHTIHNAYIYYAHENEIAVCQYIPSILKTEQNGTAVTIQQSTLFTPGGSVYNPADVTGDRHRPDAWGVNFQITCEQPTEFTLKLRLPGWLSDKAFVLVNGQPLVDVGGELKTSPPNPLSVYREGEPRPDISGDKTDSSASFLSIKRVWGQDTIRLQLPKQLTAQALPDMPDMCAFVDGPIVLAGLCEEERLLIGLKDDASTLLVPHNERQWGFWLPSYRTRNQAFGLRFKPLYDVVDEAYTVYFPIQPA